jgi:Flp pilus assembly pilin Flp
MFGMLWIDTYDSVLVLANIQQLGTAIKEEWDNIPQATINSLINSM